jgi:hypothetical protein
MNTILLVTGGLANVQEHCTLADAPLAMQRIRAIYPTLFRDESKLSAEWGPEFLQPGQTRTKLGLDGKPIADKE